ncbi:protein takeout-like [Linepithema humile]|uniref:protein takeout-like n=1 Tax=Linepithema humile TaxID=83485 RepID=UPI000623B231|nr:PREDICTED: protein takeout-like [Linepithema humile]
MKTIAIFYFAVIATTIAVELPSNFKTCKRSDPNMSQCLTNVVKEAIIFLADGLESLKIEPLEQMKFEFKINGTHGPVQMTQEYQNGKLYGLTKRFELHDFQIDWDNSVMKFYVFHEEISFLGDYKVQGKILVVPVYGNGKFKMSVYNVTTHHEIYFKTFEKNRESYIRVNKYFIKTFYKRVTLHYDNLFDGNEALGNNINKFVNDNSMYLFGEFVPFLEEAFARAFFKISNQIFTHVPMNKIFPLT